MSLDLFLRSLSVAAWGIVVVHVVVAIVALQERVPWKRRLSWMLLICSVPFFGPLYYLLFRSDWNETSPQALPAKDYPDAPSQEQIP